MHAGELLLRDLQENPADDTLKRAYLDWLQEYGSADRAFAAEWLNRRGKYPLTITLDVGRKYRMPFYEIVPEHPLGFFWKEGTFLFLDGTINYGSGPGCDAWLKVIPEAFPHCVLPPAVMTVGGNQLWKNSQFESIINRLAESLQLLREALE